MEKIELLAPAGDLEKLKMAITYGADGVYLGGDSFGLRKASKNFSLEEIEEGSKSLPMKEEKSICYFKYSTPMMKIWQV